MLNKTKKYGLARGMLGTILAAALVAASVPVAVSASGPTSQPNVLSATQSLAPPLGVSAAVLPAKVRATANVNLRAGSSTSHKVLLTIPAGKVVPVSGKASNGWYKVTYSGRTGWVTNSYVSTNTKAPVAPKTPRLRGPNKTSRVVLTFDDCPRTLSAFTSAVNYASANNIGLVLAPTGDCISSFKSRYGVDIAARARAKGQWVINHSISHPDLRKLSCAAAAKQLGGSGVHTNFGRPPYGAVDASVTCAYAKVGMAIWTWSRDTMDWSVKSKASRASAAKPGTPS